MPAVGAAIIGAGPHGLSATARVMNDARGLGVWVCGEAVSLWRRQMAGHMDLCSPAEGSRASHRSQALTLSPSATNRVQAGQRRSGAGALVMGADYRGLGVVRSLGRQGIPVWVLKQEGEYLAAASRYSRRSLAWPAGEDSQQVGFLLELAAKHGLTDWVLFPTRDATTALVAHHHVFLSEQYRLTTSPWEVLRCVCDKRLMNRLAEELGIARPRTFYPETRGDLAALDCPFPVILKPTIRGAANRLTTAKAWRVDDRASLLARYDQACDLVPRETLMIQEIIPGRGEAQFSYAALCNGGRPLASVVARRTRQYPMDFGRASTYVETVDEPGVIEPAIRLLEATRFTGIVEVEFKRDRRDGLYKLLDVNPRVWGWHTLCGRAGVDFPHLLWRMVHGESIPELHGRVGVRWVRTSTDLPTAVLEIMRGRLSVGGYLSSLRGPRESAIFAADDFLPGLLELPLGVLMFGRRVFGDSGS